MEGLNRVTLMGTVGSDAELKMLSDDKRVANFRLATNRSYKSGNEKKTNTEWHTIEVWGDLATFAGTYVKKGKNLFLEGELRTETFENKEGQKVTRYKIAARNIQLLPSKSNGEASATTEASVEAAASAAPTVPANKAAEQVGSYVGSESFSQVDDDLPF